MEVDIIQAAAGIIVEVEDIGRVEEEEAEGELRLWCSPRTLLLLREEVDMADGPGIAVVI